MTNRSSLHATAADTFGGQVEHTAIDYLLDRLDSLSKVVLEEAVTIHERVGEGRRLSLDDMAQAWEALITPSDNDGPGGGPSLQVSRQDHVSGPPSTRPNKVIYRVLTHE